MALTGTNLFLFGIGRWCPRMNSIRSIARDFAAADAFLYNSFPYDPQAFFRMRRSAGAVGPLECDAFVFLAP